MFEWWLRVLELGLREGARQHAGGAEPTAQPSGGIAGDGQQASHLFQVYRSGVGADAAKPATRY